MVEMFGVPFMQKALAVSMLMGVFFSFAGVYVVVRRIVFVSMALSQMAACGFAFGLLTGGVSPSFYAAAFTLGGVVIFSLHAHERRISRESFIGFMYAMFSALGVIFLSKSHAGEGGLLELFSGNIMTVTGAEVAVAAGLFTVAMLAHLAFYRKFMFVFFDGETAKTQGMRTDAWNFLFYLILGVMISASIRTTGVLVSFAYLTIPAMTALLWTQNMASVFLVAVTAGAVATIAGIMLSFAWDLPGGVSNVAVLSLIFLITRLIKRP